MTTNGSYVPNSRWVRQIRDYDVQRGMWVTHFVLCAGLLLGIGLLFCGIATGSKVMQFAGVAELLFVPILCAGRYAVLRLYLFIQHQSAELEQRDGP